jgi:hypothetical protein
MRNDRRNAILLEQFLHRVGLVEGGALVDCCPNFRAPMGVYVLQ